MSDTIYAIMVARNEADRYLDCVLNSLPTPWVHVYDDQSTDETEEIAQKHGAIVSRRPNGVPSFLENEGGFRQAAWDAFIATMDPQEGDWVLSLDCDELVIADIEVLRETMVQTCTGLDIQIPEVFSLDGPMIRTDGFWGTLHAPRLFRFLPGGRFQDQAMACGSTPTYVPQGSIRKGDGLTLLHLGYADKDDRLEKYSRYSMREGHNPVHVASILSPNPMLQKWDTPIPEIYRGRR